RLDAPPERLDEIARTTRLTQPLDLYLQRADQLVLLDEVKRHRRQLLGLVSHVEFELLALQTVDLPLSFRPFDLPPRSQLGNLPPLLIPEHLLAQFHVGAMVRECPSQIALIAAPFVGGGQVGVKLADQRTQPDRLGMGEPLQEMVECFAMLAAV